VVVRPEPIEFLPRNADPVMLDRDIAAGLADALGRPLRLVHAEDYSSMIALLESGNADVVAANLTATEGRRARVPFSLPYLHTDELLVMREDEPAPSKRAEMDGLVVTVRRSSAYAETLEGIRERSAPGLAVDWAPENVAVETLLEHVEEGKVQATVVDSHVWKAVSGHFPRLTPVLRLARDRPIALALRPDDPELKRRVDQFLIRRALTGPREEVYTDDLPGLKERRRLRMITRNNAATYFLHRGAQLGFEYELLRRFADAQGLRLEIVIPPNRTALVQWLLEGRGDVVSASLTPTEERAARVLFTDPYLHVAEFVVVRADEADAIRGPADLAGREVWVRASSTYFQAAEELKEVVPDLRIALVPENMETEEVLARVEEGTWDLTIAESHHLEIARHGGMDLSAAFSLGEGELAWAVRPEDRELAKALNAYLREEIRGLFYNVIRERYFGDTKDIVRAHDEWRSDVSGRISPWDDLAREYAGRYELDWRLVLAQMYEESRFDPDRVSWAGAQGLMQVLPRTAREMGTGDPRDPESSVHGGTKYLRWLIDSFDPQIPLAERIRFALAGYNAGRGHVVDARRLAERLDLDPDRWYGNVEQAIVLLQRPEYYEQTRYGYCRGTMARHYVREIERRYEAYVAHVPAGQPLAGAEPAPGAEGPEMSAAGSDTTFAAEAGSE
jgi:membrane-bound lytic murein transglycosylase F